MTLAQLTLQQLHEGPATKRDGLTAVLTENPIMVLALLPFPL